MIDEERLGQRFATLARIDSESRSEAVIAKVLEKELTDLGATVVFDEAGAKVALFRGGASLAKIVDGLNVLGVSPSDLVAILEALKQAGALKAEVVVI